MRDLRTEKVPFTGERSVTAPSTWGQRQAWLDMGRMKPGTPYNVTQVLLVPEGRTIGQVLDQISETVGRHEALRTLFSEDDRGELVQRVLDSGEVQVEVWTAEGSPEELLAGAMELNRRLEDAVFAHDSEPPFRAAICAPGGVPQAVIVCVTHLTADLQSTRLVAEELAGSHRPAPALQPVDVAAYEGSERGLRREASALAHLRDTLTAFPASNFTTPPGKAEELRHWRGGLTSKAVTLALEVLATRYRVSTSTVCLAATAAMLGAATGEARCGLLLIVGNRIPSELRYAVGSLAQNVPVLIDLAGPGFADLVRTVWSASMGAYRHGRFAPAKAWQEIDDVTRSRGGRPELDCFFNDMRGRKDRLPQDRTAAELRTAARETVFSWEDRRATGGTFFMEFGDVFGEPDMTRLSLFADTCLLPPAAHEALLFGMESLLIELVEWDVPLAEIAGLTGLTGLMGVSGVR
ncbi:condensation domain-containing protein [Spirillospora sp. NPDC052269]